MIYYFMGFLLAIVSLCISFYDIGKEHSNNKKQ